MKKSIITLVFIGSAVAANAQALQGKIFVGASAGYTTSKSENINGNTTVKGPKTTDYAIVPNGGFYFTDNLAVTVGIGTSGTKTETIDQNNNKDVNKISATALAAGVRYTKLYNDMAGFNLDAGVSLSSGKIKNDNVEGATTISTESKFNGLRIGVTPRVIFFPSENIGIEAGFGFLGLQSSKETSGSGNNTNEDKDSTFGLDLNTSTISFGFNFYF